MRSQGEMTLSPAIAEIPLFAGLSPVERSKLLAELEERRYAAGDVIVRAGEPGDALCLLVAGAVEVRSGPAGSEAVVAELRAPDHFGEQALLTGDPRTATVVATGDVVVASLRKPRFDALLARNPSLALHFIKILSRRLAATTRAASAMQHGFDELAAARLAGATPEERRFLTHTSILRHLEPRVVDALLGTDDAAERLDDLGREGAVTTPDGGAPYAYHPQLATALYAHLRAEMGEPYVRELHDRAGEVLTEHGDWAEAAHHYGAAGRADAAAGVLVEAGRALLEAGPEDGADDSRLRAWLAAANAGGGPASGGLLALQVAACRRLGDAEGERRALAAAGADGAVSAPMTARAEGNPAAGRLISSTDRAFRLAWSARRGLVRSPRRRVLGVLVAALFGGAFLLLPAPADLSPAAWTALGLLAVFIPILVLEVVPDYVAALLLVVAWVMLGVVPARVALSGYASGNWMLLLAVFGLGTAVTRSGLLYRTVLLGLSHLPATHTVQGLMVAALGLVFTPAMPNATGRTAMAAPLAAEIADALGYPPDSRPRAGMALATLFGFGMMTGLFLTGSSTGLLVHSVLPPEVRARFTWGAWVVAALPLHLVILVVGLAAALWLYRPSVANTVTRERLAAQRRLLGRPSRSEQITLVTFVFVLGGFVGQPLHGVDPAWIGLIGLCVLLVSGTLDEAALRNGVNWSFLLYLGVLVGLGEVFVQVKLDAWLASRLGGLLEPLAGRPFVFCLALSVAAFALSFLVRWQAASVLLTLVLAPAVGPLGINPWVVGIIALVATNSWFLPYQSTIYLALYYGMGESFEHRQVRPIAWAFAAAVLAGVVLSVPYWRALGLLD